MRPSEQANRDVEDRGLDTEQLRRLRDKLAKLEAAADVDPEQIGPYTVEARLGGGAMGRVYRCREEGELPRLVAVKLMKAGLGSEAVLRFSQECEALAKVDDPNVARVFAADVCDDGRPYVAMELIEGQTIAAYCDGQRLSLRQRLELFIGVCHGVAHVHRRHVLHRDLKPDNLLVAETDRGPMPKIVDFGIAVVAEASAIGRSDDGQALTVESHSFGTPHYVAPEQARRALSADQRSDVYGLGAVLYRLVCGIDPGRDHLGETGNTLTPCEVAGTCEPEARFKETPAEWKRRLCGDLGWIPMRAMEHDPDCRYQSAIELADEVERWLSDRPLEAAPPNRGYRLGKWVRRYRRRLAVAAVLAVFLAGGAGSTWAKHVEAVGERDRAVAAEAAAERAADVERRMASQARQAEDRATAALNSRAAALTFLQDLLVQADPRVARGQDRSVGEALEAAQAELQTLRRSDAASAATVAGLLGEIHTSRGDLERADLLWQQALDDHARAGTPDDTTAVLRARVLQGQVDAMQGELVSSRAILEPALATLRHRLDADGLLPPIERQELRQTLARGAEALGQTLHLQGDSGAAVHLIREALVIHRQEGDVEGEVAAATSLTMPLHVAAGDDGSDAAVDHALQTHQRAIDALGHDHPLATRSGNELAVLLTELHRHDEALPLYEQITATTERVLGQGHPETITQLTNLAVSQARNGDRSAAVKTARHATDQAREHLGSTSIDFAHASRLLMILLRDGGRAGEAVDTAVASADAFWAMHELPPQEAIRPTLDAAYVVLVAGGEAAQVKPLLDPLLKRLSVDRLEAMEPDLLDVHAMLWVFNHCQELDVTADHLASFAVPWFAEMRRQGGRPAVRPAIEAMRAADAIGDTTTRDSTARYLHVIGRQYPDVVPAADYAEALEVLLESAEATGDTASAATLQARLLATAGPESR